MKRAVRNFVRRRAGNRCEYCQLPLELVPAISFHIEHVVPRKHGGLDDPHNLALACYHCNLFKGPNLSGIDATSGRIVPLFDPRRQSWDRHFRWNGPILVGRTASGRATVRVLAINRAPRVRIRQALTAAGLFPP